MKIRIVFCVAIIALTTTAAVPQSGGTFQIEKSVIAGGGQTSSGGAFTLTGTLGQALAGATSTGGAFRVESGFWAEGNAPAEVEVTITGTVFTPGGAGLRNAVVTITDQSGVSRNVLTSAFGRYTFKGVLTGQTYIIRVSSKRFRFNPLQLAVASAMENVDFTGVE